MPLAPAERKEWIGVNQDLEQADDLQQDEPIEDTAPDTPETEDETPADDAVVADGIDLNEALEEANDRYLRLVAEFDNYRKRTAREKLETFGNATSNVVEKLLPVIDNFERAVEAPCTDEEYHKGVVMMLGQFQSFLEKLGVTEVPALGEAFDPNLHNAIKQAEATEAFPEGTVCEVFQKGYLLNDRLIRPAMVAVAG
ncbi:MAG: nucleotide exchange factor GrpE [Oscillospiraceae bacterium]|nr:nucleotide exchange factor GrpE [Oscillospiraceae bacterium]